MYAIGGSVTVEIIGEFIELCFGMKEKARIWWHIQITSLGGCSGGAGLAHTVITNDTHDDVLLQST